MVLFFIATVIQLIFCENYENVKIQNCISNLLNFQRPNIEKNKNFVNLINILEAHF